MIIIEVPSSVESPCDEETFTAPEEFVTIALAAAKSNNQKVFMPFTGNQPCIQIVFSGVSDYL